MKQIMTEISGTCRYRIDTFKQKEATPDRVDWGNRIVET
jgi:hypothetical protein